MDEHSSEVGSFDESTEEIIKAAAPQNELAGEEESSLRSFYVKFDIQQKEMERLEEQNAGYREKLLRTIRERDSLEEQLKSVRDAQKKETSEFERRIRDYEIQLKAVQERAAAQEAHYSVTMKDLSLKYNTSVSQLTKKADMAEKEKNDAVIKYATREAEVMRMRSEIQKKEQELAQCLKMKQELENSHSQENLEQLEKANNSLRVEVEQMKHEKFDLENKLKISEKRADACTATVTELKQQNDVLRKQLIQLKDEKVQLQEENRQLSLKTQIQESRRAHESEELSRSQQDLEQRLVEANEHCSRLADANHEANVKLDEVTRENIDLMNKLQDLEDKLSLEEEARAAASFEIAEKEAEECRQQAERMLAITEQLTQRNSHLAGEVAAEREKSCRLEQQVVETEGSLNRALQKLSEREKDLEEATGIQQLTQKLQEERTDNAALKKKYVANIKELKHELSSLRKQLDSNCSQAPLAPPPSGDSVPSTSSRSRASSLNSLDRVTTLSRDEESGSGIDDHFCQIIVLQKKLARRNDKIEFLEEHVRHCLEELQKKTKIIQHYALREEASLLLPSDGSLNKVPLSRKGASYSLMGAIFTGGSDKRSLQLAAEVNSRLQAVLEDALIKNITLKVRSSN
ncbi:unnamed protein product [Nippostrongylus brasiliensis]|uniref:CCCP-1 (inferred by orthology to a C. elegans protein) n=1 Tax=Nippostrongylus brasiliensis TaxID=27835 RepID=A0A0N4Y329_NIPBR|nr:unnamed protein product [Nippostrongylus brasiliensis]